MTAPTDPRLSETTERFLRAIAERLAPERVVEVHLFPPLRQGPIESAVAIIAVADGEASELPGISGPLTDHHDASAADGPPAVPRADGDGARLAIYTATYRHTRKGPERGAWSVEVVAQADAPLEAVAAVVRGVHCRSDDAWGGAQLAPGDGVPDADRLTGAEFRAVVASAGQPPAPGDQP